MKLSKLLITVLAGALLFLPGAFAGDTNKGALRLDEKVSVEGKQLNPGDYKVEWDGNGPNVQVNILQGKQTVVSVPAHVVEQRQPNASNAYGSTVNTDGTKSLTAFYAGGKRYSLQFEQQQASQASGRQSSK